MINLITTILPIVIIIFLFVGISKVRIKFATPKVTHWILFTYISVLLLNTAFGSFITNDKVSLKEMEKVATDGELSDIYPQLRKGEFDKIDKGYLINEKSFGVDQIKTLKVKSSNDNDLTVLVERKTSDDNKVEAFIFSSGLIIDDYDFSQLLKHYHLELKGQILTINPPKQQDIKISIAQNEFPVRQFTGDSMFINSFTSGDPVVYLRIPSDLKVMADGHVFLESVKK